MSIGTPIPTPKQGSRIATLAAGCFWGVEHIFREQFGEGKGLLDARVGYIGGNFENPRYEDVCSGTTGHTEATQITFDPSVLSYQSLVEFFYRIHDPTTIDSQGPDIGPQYRSAIFFHDVEQESTAYRVTEAANKQWWGGKIVTQIAPAGKWWDAEEYHQLYLQKTPHGYACPSHKIRPFEPLSFS